MTVLRIFLLAFMSRVVSGLTYCKEDLTYMKIYDFDRDNQLKYTKPTTLRHHHQHHGSSFLQSSIENGLKFEKHTKYKDMLNMNLRRSSTRGCIYRKKEKMARYRNCSYVHRHYVHSSIHYRYMAQKSTNHDNHTLFASDWSCHSNTTAEYKFHTIKRKLKPLLPDIYETEETDIQYMIHFISYNATDFSSLLSKQNIVFNNQYPFDDGEDANQSVFIRRSLKMKKTLLFCEKNTLEVQVLLLCETEVVETFCQAWTLDTTSLQIYWKLPWEIHHATTSDSIEKEMLNEQHKLSKPHAYSWYHTFDLSTTTAYIFLTFIQFTIFTIFTFQNQKAKSSLILLASLLMLNEMIIPNPRRKKKQYHAVKHNIQILAKENRTKGKIFSSFMPYFPSKHRKKLNLKNSTFLTWVGTTKVLNSLKQSVSRVYYTQSKNKSFLRRKQLRCPRKYVRRKNGPFVFGKKIKKHCQTSKNNLRESLMESLLTGFLTAWKQRQHQEETLFKKSENAKKDRRLFDLFTLPQSFIFPLTEFLIYPVFRSLGQYFSATTSSSDITQSTNSIQESLGLEIELLRVSTYSSFPNGNAPSTLALAKAGFFYTQNNDTVECFHCHFQHSNWTKNDNPAEIHKRMSPTCEFIRGQPTYNVPVNRSHVVGNTSDTLKCKEVPRPENKETCSTVTDNSNHNCWQRASRSSETTGATPSPPPIHYGDRGDESKTPTAGHQLNPTRRDRPSKEASKSLNTNYTPRSHAKATAPNSHPSYKETIQPVLQLEPLGICQARPRYPAYAVLSVRMSTYQGWPPTAGQSPRIMATAGFIFAGYADYTRCFFCGGGLRNWEPEDDPWIEHAKWFPKCVYLRQNKGDNFVQLVHQNLDGKLTESSGQLTLPSVNEQPVSRTLQQSNSQFNAQDPSVQSVHEMGYSVELITQAINSLKLERRPVDAQNILETIFIIEETKPVSKHEGRAQMQENYQEHAGAHSKPTSANAQVTSNEQVDMSEYLSLVAENRSLKEQRQCKICLDKEATIAFVPCGHISCCPECSYALRKCPICRNAVSGTIKTYLA